MLFDNQPTTYGIRLDPYEIRSDFRVDKHKENFYNYYHCTQTVIVIFVDDYQTSGGLNPPQYDPFFELIFDIDEASNTLIVSGIEAQPSDYFLCRCLPLWSCFTESGRQKEIIMVSGFKAFRPENEGLLRRDDKDRMTIFLMINYDGERKKNDEGGFTWSSGAHTKWKAISFVKNQLTLDGVAHRICAALGLNLNEVKLMLSYLPENITDPFYFQDSRFLMEYLTIYPRYFKIVPHLHVKIDAVKSNDISSSVSIHEVLPR
ncbi:uncharacterized protein [Henckelia pumila]